MKANGGYFVGFARALIRGPELDDQMAALFTYGCRENNIHISNVDTAGRRDPGLEAALLDAVPGDTLVVTRLVCLATFLKSLTDTVRKYREQHTDFGPAPEIASC